MDMSPSCAGCAWSLFCCSSSLLYLFCAFNKHLMELFKRDTLANGDEKLTQTNIYIDIAICSCLQSNHTFRYLTLIILLFDIAVCTIELLKNV